MRSLLSRIAAVSFALFVLGGLTFGAMQALSPSPTLDCTGPTQVGSCPPLDNGTCWTECIEEDYLGGMCSHGCCTCLT